MLKVCLCILFSKNQELSTLLDGSHNFTRDLISISCSKLLKRVHLKKQKGEKRISVFYGSHIFYLRPLPILCFKILRKKEDGVSTSFVVNIDCESVNKAQETTLCFNQF